jgi:hypothetical protein
MRSNQRLNYGSPGNAMPPPRPDDDTPNLDFTGKLNRAVADIKQAASGRTCSGCQHIRNGWCAEHLNIDGQRLMVHYPGAIACSTFEAST